MIHPLDGARLKIVRAQEHLKSFNECAMRYINTEPHQTIVKREGDFISVEAVITTDPPPILACIVGDFVTNLRASIDYVAWELFIKFGPPTLAEKQKRGITFPICSSNADFSKSDSKASYLSGVCGIPATAMTVIESVQPYNAGYEPLDTLNLLVNRDKHRMLLLCSSAVLEGGDVSIFRGDELWWRTQGGIKSQFNVSAFGPGLIEGPPFNVKVETKPTILIALKDFPMPPKLTYVGILENVLKCVANIVPRFDSFF